MLIGCSKSAGNFTPVLQTQNSASGAIFARGKTGVGVNTPILKRFPQNYSHAAAILPQPV